MQIDKSGFDQIKIWKDGWPLSDYDKFGRRRHHQASNSNRRAKQVNGSAEGEYLITTGVSQHQMWVAQHFRWRHPRTIITSGGLGTMGYGLPAAIGAKVARPEALVIDIDGDASFNMTLTELSTAAQYNIGVKDYHPKQRGAGYGDTMAKPLLP